jgi:hypothetical protein
MDWLLVIAEREALWWVLSEERMAFPAGRKRDARRLAIGDRLLLYTTRGCFHNPTRDRGRVIGEAHVAGPVESLRSPLVFDGREFPLGCELTIERLAPARTGVELGTLIDRLETFPNKRAWSATLRRPLVKLTPADTRLLDRDLEPLLIPRAGALAKYRALCIRGH